MYIYSTLPAWLCPIVYILMSSVSGTLPPVISCTIQLVSLCSTFGLALLVQLPDLGLLSLTTTCFGTVALLE